MSYDNLSVDVVAGFSLARRYLAMSGSVLETLRRSQVPVKEGNKLWVDLEFEAKYPELYLLMTMRVWKGKKRVPTKVSVFTNRGVLKVSLACPSEGRIAYLPISDFEDLFGCVESALTSGGIDWQPLTSSKLAGIAS